MGSLLTLFDDESLLEKYGFDFNVKYTSLPPLLAALGFTYTRNSLKNVMQDGALVSLTANQFGTSYDPVTGMYGYVPEPAATNLALYSEGAAANWTVSNVADGSTFFGADNALDFGDNSVERSAYKSCSLTNATTYTVSVFVKMDDGLAPVVGAANNAGDFSIESQATIHSSAALIRDCGNGVYRVSSSRAATATGAANCGIRKYVGQSARTFKITRIQVETSTRATSYIKTAGATAARAVDVLTCSLANIPWFNGATCTLFASHRDDSTISVNGRIVQVDDGTSSNRFIFYRNITPRILIIVVQAGINEMTGNFAAFSNNKHNAAASFQTNNSLVSYNGTTGTADTSVNLPSGLTTLRIGCNHVSTEAYNGFIYRIALIPKVLEQAHLNAMTA